MPDCTVHTEYCTDYKEVESAHQPTVNCRLLWAFVFSVQFTLVTAAETIATLHFVLLVQCTVCCVHTVYCAHPVINGTWAAAWPQCAQVLQVYLGVQSSPGSLTVCTAQCKVVQERLCSRVSPPQTLLPTVCTVQL